MSKQQTLFNFLGGQKKGEPRHETGNGPPKVSNGSGGLQAVNQDNDDVFDDDLLLAACEDWEETSHGRNDNARSATSGQSSFGSVKQPFQTRHVQQPIPEASQLEDLPGFDASAGKIWIYPTNYPIREYQYNIVQQGLFKNTMVSLPTGLGKTFVAAVVMYNFYRWYPEGRVVFMAPTKPLVAQQIEACHDVMGIQQSDMAEMTGNMPPVERVKAWRRCRVFFLTPQVLMNDLSRRACPTQLVKCLVVDEAHKALGNHSYCQVVRELSKYSSEFRVLALSATPGSDLKAIQQVLSNLLISHIEIRSEDSIDIQRYVHERKVEKVVVALDDEMKAFRDQYLQILSVYVGRLVRCGALYNKDPATLTKFQILQARDAFRQDPPPQVKSRGVVEGDFALCISLYHGFELLLQHGLRSLYSFLQSTVDGDKGFTRTRQELLRNGAFVQLMDKLRDKFGGDEKLNQSHRISSPGTTRVREVKPYVISHPKMAKLQEIVLDHFRTVAAQKESPTVDKPSTSKDKNRPDANSTRVMIFAQYRDSVNEIAEMLNRHRPLLRCMGFVGQASAGKTSKGISQKEQLRVVREFREGGYNTLVCTCVGEEGLDIGEVDLIVCYDAHKSPIRLVQRMGRTGRKRQGRIVMLVTEGKEAAIYDRSQYSKKGIVKALQGNARSLQLYPNNPRMVPQGLNPTPHKMSITVQAFKSKDAKRKSSAGVRKSEGGVLTSKGKAKSNKKSGEFLSAEELAYWSANYKLDTVESLSVPIMPDRGRYVTLEGNDDKQPRRRKNSHPRLSLTEWTPWQMNKQPVGFVEHSLRCQHFVELMEFIDLQNLTEGDDIYGLEMQTYLDEQDIIRPRKKGIEQFCVRVRKDADSGIDDPGMLRGRSILDKTQTSLPGRSNSDKPQTSLQGRSNSDKPKTSLPGRRKSDKSKTSPTDSMQESSQTKAKKPLRKRAKKTSVPLELMSSSSDSDNNLPDVFHAKNKDSTASPRGHSKSPREKAEKQNDAGDEGGSQGKKDSPEETPVKACKSRKHKQKTKHLKAVLNSSDDDDFTADLKHDHILADKKSASPGNEEDDRNTVNDINSFSNPKTAHVEYETPEPMDTDSDTFLTLKGRKASEPIVDNASPGGLHPQTDDDFSFLFPSDSICLPPPTKTSSEIRPNARKPAIPPPPPSLSSLDFLDETDTTFDLTQHFQNKSTYFGAQKDESDQPSTLIADPGPFTDESVMNSEEDGRTSEPNLCKKLEKILPAPPTAPPTAPERIVSDEDKSSTLTNISSTDKLGEVDMKENLFEDEDNYLAGLTGIEPQFDLNIDFSDSEDDDDPGQKKTSKIRTDYETKSEVSPSQTHGREQLFDHGTSPNDISMGSIMHSPEAFDIDTPQIQSAQVERSKKSTSSRRSLQTTKSKHSTSGTEDTPKSGLEPQTKSTRFHGECRDGVKGPSYAERQGTGSKRELNWEVQKEQEWERTSILSDDKSIVPQKEGGRLNKEIPGPAEPDSATQKPPTSMISTLVEQWAQILHEEEPAEMERLRMEVIGSAEPKFDLGFDLDSLDEDDDFKDDINLVSPSSNMQQRQDYTKLTQIALPKDQCSSASRGTTNIWTRASSTPVSIKMESKFQAPQSSDFLSPISTDKSEGLPRIISGDHLECLPQTAISKSPRTISVADEMRTERPKKQKKKSVTELSTSPVVSIKPRTTALANKECRDKNAKPTIARKRKSCPIKAESNGKPSGIRHRKSDPPGSTLQSSHRLGAVSGELSVEIATRTRECQQRMSSPEKDVIVMDEDEEPSSSQGKGVIVSTEQPAIRSDDEDDILSQVVHHKKRRKAMALTSPPTPAFKTPVKPSMRVKTTGQRVVTSSDEDLESPLIRRPKKRRQIIATDVDDHDDDDFIVEPSNRTDTSQAFRRISNESRKRPAVKEQRDKWHKPTKKTRFNSGSARARDFLEEEVGVSDNELYSSDEMGSDLDNSLEGFINNASQLTQASQSALMAEDMHAVYMQSVRSPKGEALLRPNRNRFKMVQRTVPDDLEIFSQMPLQDDTYYENSFVVREGEDDNDVIEGDRWKPGRKDNPLEKTINPDNIITSRRRGRNKVESRAQHIMKEGRKRVFMSSSSTSTSTDEADDDLGGRERKMRPQHNQKEHKVPRLATGKMSAGRMFADKSNKQVSSEKPGPVRNPVPVHQAAHVKTSSQVLQLSQDIEKGRHVEPDQHQAVGPASVIRQFLEGNRSDVKAHPDNFQDRKHELGSNKSETDLTLAEKERAERLKRQDEKKREFMKKMEEKKRQHQQQQSQESNGKLQQQEQQRQKQQLPPLQSQLQQQYPKQLQQFKQTGDKRQLQQFQKTQQQQQQHVQQSQQLKSKHFDIGRSSHGAATQNKSIKEVQLKKQLSSSTTSTSVTSLKSGIRSTATLPARNSDPKQNLKMPPDAHQGMRAVSTQGTWRVGSQGKVQPRSPPVSPRSMQLMNRTTLAGSQEALNQGKPVILIDSKELSSSSHIVSTLALQYNMNPIICQLTGCDYIVSARMGVEKKTLSDFGNGANRSKLIDRMRHLCELFDRPCLILEKDRVKPADDKKPRQLVRTKYFDSTLAALTKTHIKVLYSDSVEDTARILADLVSIEARKGEGLAPPPLTDPTQEQILKLYLSLPRVSYGIALSLMKAFPSVQQLINSSPEDLQRRARISLQRSSEIVNFLHQHFDEQMLSLSVK